MNDTKFSTLNILGVWDAFAREQGHESLIVVEVVDETGNSVLTLDAATGEAEYGPAYRQGATIDTAAVAATIASGDYVVRATGHTSPVKGTGMLYTDITTLAENAIERLVQTCTV